MTASCSGTEDAARLRPPPAVTATYAQMRARTHQGDRAEPELIKRQNDAVPVARR